MSAFETPRSDYEEMFWPQVVRGLAIMLCLLPPIRLALGHLPVERVPDASGLFNLMRNLGGAIGLALIDTVIFGRAEMHGRDLAARLSQWRRGGIRLCRAAEPASAYANPAREDATGSSSRRTGSTDDGHQRGLGNDSVRGLRPSPLRPGDPQAASKSRSAPLNRQGLACQLVALRIAVGHPSYAAQLVRLMNSRRFIRSLIDWEMRTEYQLLAACSSGDAASQKGTRDIDHRRRRRRNLKEMEPARTGNTQSLKGSSRNLSDAFRPCSLRMRSSSLVPFSSALR